jgi:hypothetical protein
METFSIEAMVRGYHVYQDIWNATVGEELYCQREIFFAEHNFRGWRPIRENRENYAPQKFGAIRYMSSLPLLRLLHHAGTMYM